MSECPFKRVGTYLPGDFILVSKVCMVSVGGGLYREVTVNSMSTSLEGEY